MLEERARELGRLIGQSSEYQAVKRANEALSGDDEAMELMRKLEQLRTDAQRMIERGEQPSEEMERELDSLLEQVQRNPAYQRVLVAQENFDKIMARTNEWILDGIKKGSASPIITLG
ncbi:MAG TPA: YlbF family regulator [Gemmatimonadaceae bacterium]|nr:YlbF family regulator [Gemmatimonadaceae bacterium]